jgi:DNA-binding MarR family transcriptional regulator
MDLKKRFPSDTTVSSIALEFARRLQADFLSKIANLELSPAMANTLRELSAGEPLSQQELALRLEIGKASMGEMLSRLERAGLIIRIKSVIDRRAIRLALTPMGDSAIAELGNAAEAQIAMLREKIGDENIKQLTILLGIANAACGGPMVESLE